MKPHLLAISPDGKTLAATSMLRQEIRLFDLATGKMTQEIAGTPTPIYNTSGIVEIAFSSNNREFFIFYNHPNQTSELVVTDLNTGLPGRKFSGKGNGIMKISPSEKYLLAENQGGIFELYDFQKGTRIKTFNALPERTAISDLALAPDDKTLVLCSPSGDLSFINLFTEKNEATEPAPLPVNGNDRLTTHLRFSPMGNRILAFDRYNNEIIIWSYQERQLLTTLKVPEEQGDIVFSPETPILGFTTDETQVLCVTKSDNDPTHYMLSLVDIETQQSTLESMVPPLSAPTGTGWIAHYWQLQHAVPSPDNARVYFAYQGDANIWVTDFGESPQIAVPGPLVNTFVQAVTFSATDQEVFHANQHGEIYRWDLSHGVFRGLFAKCDLDITSLSCTADNSRLIVKGITHSGEEANQILALELDMKTGRQLSQKTLPENSEGVGQQINNGRNADGRLHFWGLPGGPSFLNNNQGQSLALAILPGSGKDYVVLLEDGRFDGTPRAIQDLLYVSENSRPAGIEKYKARYYTPLLLQKFAFPNQKGVPAAAPSVQVERNPALPDQYKVTLINNKGGIGPVELFVNGKLVNEDTRKLVSPNPAQLTDKPSVTFTLHLSALNLDPTGNNQLRLVAYDKGKNIYTENTEITLHKREGNSAVLSKTTPPRQSATAANTSPHLWLIAIGVSNYANPELNLRFSAKDAEAVVKTMQMTGGYLFGEKHIHTLKLTSESPSDRQPTKPRIMEALRQVREKASFHDVIMVYLSGHGIAHQDDQDNDFYFLTAEARNADHESSETRQRQSLSGKEIREFLNAAKARKQVLIMDACASGKFADQLTAGRDLSELVRKGLSRMRDRTATYILTGNAGGKKSYESSAFGQGLLTYTLLQGIRGAALRDDKFIDVSQLFQYARDQVELLSGEINLRQVPVIVAPANSESFDLGLVPTLKDRAAIPVSEARPVFTRTNLLQAGEFADPLELSQALDDKLYEFSYQEAAPLMFVQTAYPGAYHVAGEYQLSGEKVLIKAKVFQDKAAKGTITFSGPQKDVNEQILKQLVEIINR